VEAFYLARRGRRVGSGEAVLDPVFVTDPVEEHRSWSRAESGREDLAIVGEDLVRGTVLLEGEEKGVTDRPGRGSGDDPGTDAVSAVVVDAGDHLHLGAVGQIEPAHDVHLPELHGLRPLPPLVVRLGSLARSGLEQSVTDQGPVDRGSPR
jgi:hypothetical protein